MRILVIEDDDKIATALRTGLTAEGYEVTIAGTGEEGFYSASAETPDLLLLDLMLPGKGGLEILRTLRKKNIRIPILVLTARDALEDRITGLDAGADDYLVKPFAFAELLARIRALSRRDRQATQTKLVFNDLELDLMTRKVRRANHSIELTVREFELLEYLLRNQNQLVSREMLGSDVWRETTRATPLDNVIDVHIARLRKKIDLNSDLKKLIHTVRGVGFKLGDPG